MANWPFFNAGGKNQFSLYFVLGFTGLNSRLQGLTGGAKNTGPLKLIEQSAHPNACLKNHQH